MVDSLVQTAVLSEVELEVCGAACVAGVVGFWVFLVRSLLGSISLSKVCFQLCAGKQLLGRLW